MGHTDSSLGKRAVDGKQEIYLEWPKSRRISKMVSRLGENSLSCPAPVFVEFKYSVIYGKMFFQQEITDAEVSTSYADC